MASETATIAIHLKIFDKLSAILVALLCKYFTLEHSRDC